MSEYGHRRMSDFWKVGLSGAVVLAFCAGSSLPASSQNMVGFRGPSINTVNVGPHVMMNPNLGPNTRYSPNMIDDDGPSVQPKRARLHGSDKNDGSDHRPTPKISSSTDTLFVVREVVTELDGNPTDEQAKAIGRRHRLTPLETQNFPLIGSTFMRWRIADSRPVHAVVRELATDGIKSQPNYRFKLQQATAAPEGDPAQYALAKLRLPEAHALAHGQNVTIAVIDSGIDTSHPELAGSIDTTFDALGGKGGFDVHGTGVASVITSHARLMGGAPSARIVAIRAFGMTDGHVESTSFVVLKSLDFAAAHGARVINMSFAGPDDPLLKKALAAAADKGLVLVAAGGNAGPQSPPLFPAADRNVIAVSATDASDKLFPASNRGSYIAIAAPGADILTAAPGGKYQVISGTSFAAAYISSLVALVIERNPALTPAEVRTILAKTARDLGAPGRDDLFGAGEADAFAAVSAAGVPVATASERSPSSSDANTISR